MQLYSVGTKIIRGKRNKRVVDKRREERACVIYLNIFLIIINDILKNIIYNDG